MFDIREITQKSEEYPQELLNIPQAPKQLFLAGAPLIQERRIAIVGTRRFSSYGKQVALQFAAELAQAGLVIVSGLAPGIDTFAHQATVDQHKRTIAVAGSGLDPKSLYPKENLKLAQRIMETGGTLVSEYPPETVGTNYTFPQRNRIISGLSMAVLVVEAKKKSGSLITAEYARRHRRKLFAIPGSIYSSNSRGTHIAIRNLGAVLAQSSMDILDELGLSGISSREDSSNLTPDEQKIFDALEVDMLTADQLTEQLGLPAQKILSILAVMELDGKIKNLGGSFVKAI